MHSFQKLVDHYTDETAQNCTDFCPAGQTFTGEREYYRGKYWYYETPDFIVDIHDMLIKKDYVEAMDEDLSQYILLSSSYIITGSGEWLSPYQALEPDSLFIFDAALPTDRCLMHGNSVYKAVGIRFKESFIANAGLSGRFASKDKLMRMFYETRTEIIQPIRKLAMDILNCKMEGTSAALFFNAKAHEWLAITLDAYEQQKTKRPLAADDQAAIDTVARYIQDHYAFHISQTFLEKLAAMSGTKLKECFKQHYNMSITEFTQRKRMNIAENLLLTTDMEIRDIAKAVGYSSPSRFSTLYKRYKNMRPGDVKALAGK